MKTIQNWKRTIHGYWIIPADRNILDIVYICLWYPEQVYSAEVQQQRFLEALDEANYQIHFYENPAHPEGWELVSEREFTFEFEINKSEVIWVSITKPVVED